MIPRLGTPFSATPLSGKSNKLITTALPYVNNTPHLGNIIGCVLSGDVCARFERLMGRNCLFLGGTDEYGTATEFKAFQEGLTPKEICDKYYPEHADTYRWLDIDFDVFGRTTNPHHKQITQDIFAQLLENDMILESEGDYSFCEHCEKFLADRFVHGICPKCQFNDARGDQCDKCGALLTPTELIEPVCNRCSQKRVVSKRSQHIFLDLPKLQSTVERIVPPEGDASWSANALAITNAWLRKGLEPRCISRDLEWGIPVPNMPGKVFYVWFDAPVGYISITEQLLREGNYEPAISWLDWWKPRVRSDVELVQFMGKDNTPFHTLIFPSMLLGADERFVTVDRISVTEYLNYEHGKFSKSRGLGVFGPDMMQSGIESDYWRFYMLWKRPEHADTSFLWDEFQEVVNSRLNDQYGNLLLRVQKLFVRHCREADDPMVNGFDYEQYFGNIAAVKDYTEAMERFEYRRALGIVMELVGRVNGFLTEREPWKLARQPKSSALAIKYIFIALAGVLSATVMLHPFVPAATIRVLDYFGLTEKHVSEIRIWEAWNLFRKIDAASLGEPVPLFRQIDVQPLKERFRPPSKHFSLGEHSDITWPFVLVHLKDLKIGKSNAQVKQRMAEILGCEHPNAHSRRVAYAQGRETDAVDNGQHRISIENLAANGIPSINAAVDLYNAHSHASATVCGLYDAANIQGERITYRKARGDEEFHAIGRKADAEQGRAQFHPGDWALVDEGSNIITLALTKQSSRVAVTNKTTEAVLCCQGSPAHSREQVLEFAQTVARDIVTHCGGSFDFIEQD